VRNLDAVGFEGSVSAFKWTGFKVGKRFFWLLFEILQCLILGGDVLSAVV